MFVSLVKTIHSQKIVVKTIWMSLQAARCNQKDPPLMQLPVL
jgi:hypothetical protein